MRGKKIAGRRQRWMGLKVMRKTWAEAHPTGLEASGDEVNLFNLPAKNIPQRIADNLPLIREYHSHELEVLAADFRIDDYSILCYVEPDGQSLNPADSQDDDTGLVPRESMLAMLARYLSGKAQFTHAFILSDAGMGKTTLLTILKLAAIDKLVTPGLHVELLKIGPALLETLKLLPHRSNTILLLDALDEDKVAWSEFNARVEEILTATNGFKKVVITCRTQFFPEKLEREGDKSGMVTINGHHCSKLYLSPFDDAQVDEYLLRRFPHEDTRSKAKEIVTRMKSLKFRPMLLSYVDLLLHRDETFERAFDLYKALVDEWFNRELRKGLLRSEDETILRHGCKVVADYMYSKKISRLDHIELRALVEADPDVAKLDEMKVEGRSLLHRTSEGGYKFAHQSLMEFFVALRLLDNPRPIQTSDQIKLFLTDLIDTGELERLEALDLSGIILTKLQRRGLKAANANLEDSKFEGCDLAHAVFKGAALEGAIWESTDLTSANFLLSKLDQAQFRDCDLSQAMFSSLSLDGFDIVDCRAASIDLDGLSVRKLEIDDSTIDSLQMSNSSFFKGTAARLRGSDWKIEDTQFSQCFAQILEFAKAAFHGLDCDSVTIHEMVVKDLVLTKCRLEKTDIKNLAADTLELRSTHVGSCVFVSSQFGVLVIDDKCSLETATFTDCTTQSSTVSITECSGLRINSSTFVDLSWDDLRASNWTVSSTRIEGASFRYSRFSKSTLVALVAVGTIFADSEFTSLSLEKCEFVLTDFSRATWRNAEVSASFTNCDFAKTSFLDCQFLNCSFVGADLSQTRLERCRWRRCDLTDASSARIHFGECIDLRIVSARIPAASFAGRKIERLIADRADISASAFTGSTVADSSFESTLLTQADLNDATFRQCDFRGADMSAARVHQTKFENCKISDQTRLPNELNAEQRRSLGVS